MKRIVTLSFLLLIAFKIHAQRNFKPGYIVSLKGDTLKGWVDYKDWNQNPRQINFKTAETSNAEQYNARTISAFGVNGLEAYTRYIGPVSQASVETAKLINNRDITVKPDSVFLRLITTGKNLSLFEYADDTKDRYFIAGGPVTPMELNFYRYFNAKNDRVITDKVYQQQLQRFVANYQPGNQKLINQVQSADYNVKDIEQIVLRINGTENKSADKRSATVFFAGLAANATNIAFNSGTKSSTSILPQLNAGVNFILNKNVGTVIFRAELNATGTTADIKPTIISNFPGEVLRTTFNEFVLSAAPQVIYNFYNTEKLKAFVGGGLGINYAITSKQKDYFASGEMEYNTLSSVYFSTILKAGISLKKLEVYAGFNRPIQDYVENSIRRRSYQLGINYLIK